MELLWSDWRDRVTHNHDRLNMRDLRQRSLCKLRSTLQCGSAPDREPFCEALSKPQKLIGFIWNASFTQIFGANHLLRRLYVSILFHGISLQSVFTIHRLTCRTTAVRWVLDRAFLPTGQCPTARTPTGLQARLLARRIFGRARARCIRPPANRSSPNPRRIRRPH